MRRFVMVVCSALLGLAVYGLLASRPNSIAAELSPGDKVPPFVGLEGTDGKTYSLDGLKEAKAVVVCFTCNDCPVAMAYQERFKEFAKAYQAKGVVFIAINSNTATEDLGSMKKLAKEQSLNFPYVLDKDGKAADGFGAKVTPHVFVLDGKRNLAFAGPFDNKQTSPTKHYVADAVDAVLTGKTPEVAKAKPFGCGIHRTSN